MARQHLATSFYESCDGYRRELRFITSNHDEEDEAAGIDDTATILDSLNRYCSGNITNLIHSLIADGATLFHYMDYADLKRTKSFSTVSNIIFRSSSLSWISILLICSDWSSTLVLDSMMSS
jgi:hypothetical protein